MTLQAWGAATKRTTHRLDPDTLHLRTTITTAEVRAANRARSIAPSKRPTVYTSSFVNHDSIGKRSTKRPKGITKADQSARLTDRVGKDASWSNPSIPAPPRSAIKYRNRNA